MKDVLYFVLYVPFAVASWLFGMLCSLLKLIHGLEGNVATFFRRAAGLVMLVVGLRCCCGCCHRCCSDHRRRRRWAEWLVEWIR